MRPGWLLPVACVVTACLSEPPRAPADQSTWQTAFQRGNWLSEWRPKSRGQFGLREGNVSVETEGGGKFHRFLRIRYPKGASSPSGSRKSGAPIGGAQWLGTLASGPVDRLFLRYFVRFAPDFDFVKGGKLPGFYGGERISGGRIPDGTDGFSTRFMWRRNGDGEVYAYLPSSQRFGTSLGRGMWRFEPGRWHCIEQELVLNTPGTADGGVRVWLDGKPAFEQPGLLFRTVASLQIEGVLFSTFYGGGDASWAPRQDTYADFAAFATGPHRIGCDAPSD